MGDSSEDKPWQFKKGQSGNPAGRKPIADGGAPNDPHNLRKYIAEHAHQIIGDMVRASTAGDTTASNNLLKFILPTLAAVQVETDQKALPIMRVITAIQEANEEIKQIEEQEQQGQVIDATPVEDDNVTIKRTDQDQAE